MTTIISRLAGVTIIRMVKFFIQLYSSNDYFVRFYWIGDRASTTREERGGGKRGFNSNIKRIIPALFVLQFERNWICPLLYPRTRSGFGDTNFIRSRKFGYFRILSLFSVDYLNMRLIGRKYLNLKDWNGTNINCYIYLIVSDNRCNYEFVLFRLSLNLVSRKVWNFSWISWRKYVK